MRRFHPKIVAPPHSNLPFEVVMVESFDGDLVRYADHAAELARVEGERDSIRNAVAEACMWSGCNSAKELRAALDRTHKRATNAEKENALLRAECEAKQKKIDAAYDAFVHIAEYWNGSDNDRAVADALEVMRNSATDAAGILKGGE